MVHSGNELDLDSNERILALGLVGAIVLVGGSPLAISAFG